MARTDERSLKQTPAEVHQPLHASHISLPHAPTFRQCRAGHYVPAQLEFFAEDEELTIVPYFSLETDNSTFNSIAVSQDCCGIRALVLVHMLRLRHSRSAGAGRLWTVPTELPGESASVAGSDAAQAKEMPHNSS